MSHLACHASAPKGMKCADCTMGGIPCPECYRVHWKTMYPGEECHPSNELIMLDLRMIIRWFVRSPVSSRHAPLPGNIVTLLKLHDFEPDGHYTDADIWPTSPTLTALMGLHEEIARLKSQVNGNREWQHTRECSLHNSIRLGNGDMPQCICEIAHRATPLKSA